MGLSRSEVWNALLLHKQEIETLHMREMFQDGGNRFEQFSLQWGELMLDYSKNRITSRTMELLLDLARSVELEKRRDEMFDGAPINRTENRAVLHTALRRPPGYSLVVDGLDLSTEIADVLAQMKDCCERVISGSWKGYTGKRMTDVVNIGIGGSDLGPCMVTEALRPFAHGHLQVHFVSNIDGTHISETLKKAQSGNDALHYCLKNIYDPRDAHQCHERPCMVFDSCCREITYCKALCGGFNKPFKGGGVRY